MRLIIVLILMLISGTAFSQPQSGSIGAILPGANLSAGSVTATGGTTARTLGARNAQQINIKDFGAVGNTKSLPGGSMAASSTIFNATTTTFTSSDVGKQISIDGAGVNGVPLVTSIVSFTDSTHVVLGNSASTSTPYYYATYAAPATLQAGSGSYAPGDTITLTGGTAVTQAILTVTATGLSSATITSGGNGGTAGICTVTGTTGTSVGATGLFQISVTIAGGAISSVGSVVYQGIYTTNPTTLTAEPVTGCGLSGATLNVKMGVVGETITTKGNYSVVPTNPVSQSSTSGNGTGATFTLGTSSAGNFVYGTDDSAAIANAITYSNTLTTSNMPIVLYAPAGNYLIKSISIPTFYKNPTGVIGDGHLKTFFTIDPSYIGGNVFSWSEDWEGNSWPYNSPTMLSGTSAAGPMIEGFSIVGDRTSTSQQNAIVFFDREDEVYMNDVDVLFLRGRAIFSGSLLNATESWIRESRFNNVRLFADGDTNTPVVEFNSLGGGDSTNELDLVNFDIYNPYGTGLLFHTNVGTTRGIRINNLRIEGAEFNSSGISADLMQIGDSALTGAEQGIWCINCEFVSPYLGYSALHFLSPSGGSEEPNNIYFYGGIGAGAGLGGGINIASGNNLSFKLAYLTTAGVGINVASSTTTGASLTFDGGGQEPSWSWVVDPTATNFVRVPMVQFGVPTLLGTQQFLSAQTPNGAVTGGNSRGNNCVDWQQVRFANTQVCSASNSVISGGGNNTNTGTDAVIAGGSGNGNAGFLGTVGGGGGNSVFGEYATIPGGGNAQAVGYGEFAYASGVFSTTGDAQWGEYILRGTGSSTSNIRLTADNATAGSLNCVNIAANRSYALTATLIASDRTNNAKSFAAVWGGGSVAPHIMATGTSVPSSILIDGVNTTINADFTRSVGTLTGVGAGMIADTTNGCMNIYFSPPTGNTDTWQVVGKIDTVEVQ